MREGERRESKRERERGASLGALRIILGCKRVLFYS